MTDHTDREPNSRRRTFLKTTGTLAVASAIAGCSGGGDGGDGGGSDGGGSDGGGSDGGGSDGDMDGGDGGGETTTESMPTFENKAGKPVGENWDAVQDLAQDEPDLTVYATIDRGPFDEWSSSFQDEYGVAVNHVTGGSEKLVSRYDSEYQTDNAQASLVIMGSKIKRLWQNGQVMKLSPDYLPSWQEMPTKFKDGNNNNWIAIRQLMGSVFYNKDMVSESAASSWMDVVNNPDWQGQKIGWDPTPNMFLMSWLYENVGKKLFTTLRDAEPRWVDSHTDLARLCGAGEFPVAFTYTHKMGRFGNKLPVEYFPFDPMPSVVSPAVVNNKAPAPNSALLFLNWLTSVAGQNVLGSTQYIPIHPDAEYKGYPGVYPGDGYEVDIIPLDTDIGQMQERWKNIMGDQLGSS